MLASTQIVVSLSHPRTKKVLVLVLGLCNWYTLFFNGEVLIGCHITFCFFTFIDLKCNHSHTFNGRSRFNGGLSLTPDPKISIKSRFSNKMKMAGQKLAVTRPDEEYHGRKRYCYL